MAAAQLYKANGDKKAEKRVNQAMKKYEKELEKSLCEWDEDDEDWDLADEGLPFN